MSNFVAQKILATKLKFQIRTSIQCERLFSVIFLFIGISAQCAQIQRILYQGVISFRSVAVGSAGISRNKFAAYLAQSSLFR